jgi:Lon protease-like protein
MSEFRSPPNNTAPIPDEVPVMPLPGALLFPNSLLPLYIFEQRFCEMLEHALTHHRMFCVALVKPDRMHWETSADFFHVSTAGLVRACVGRGDGTSNLILQGLRRVRFKSFIQEAPFPIARIEPLHSAVATSIETEALAAKVLELYDRFKGNGRQLPAKVDRYLSDLTDPEMLADLMASTFINDPLRRQEVLEELAVNQRLRLVIQYLREESGASHA